MRSPWFELKTSIVGFILTVVGALSNISVMKASGGRMPVFGEECQGWEGYGLDYRHVCGTGGTPLAGLADWIRVGHFIYSPGDFVITFGQVMTLIAVVLMIFWIIKKRFAQ